jgi:hypothetical protein
VREQLAGEGHWSSEPNYLVTAHGHGPQEVVSYRPIEHDQAGFMWSQESALSMHERLLFRPAVIVKFK